MKSKRLRVSIGSAAVLGLLQYRLDVPPTTSYIMSYTEEPCIANCGFCAQACGSVANIDQLSRIIWPDFPLEDVLKGFKKPVYPVIERICYQVINYPGFLEDTIDMIKIFKDETKLPVSVDICPVSNRGLKGLRNAGAEFISIPLDGASEVIFNKVKGLNVGGPYRWETHLKALDSAVKIFGVGNVGSNIIVGLGESESDVVFLIQKLHQMGVIPVLFAFTPIQGTQLENLTQPDLGTYRRIQIARYLIVNEYSSVTDFDIENGQIKSFNKPNLKELLSDGEVFRTTGCPGCNRPFYNERPSGPFYNYPRKLKREEIDHELSQHITKLIPPKNER